MFDKNFTVTVTTDQSGNFDSSMPVTSPFSLEIKVTAILLSPANTTIHASFGLSAADGSGDAPARAFVASTGAGVDLGKWKVFAGDDANMASAKGSTVPPAPHSEISVQFSAAPSIF